jgi:hypothetical protein
MTDEASTDHYGCSTAYRWRCDQCSGGVVLPTDSTVERMRAICYRLPYAANAAVAEMDRDGLTALLRRAAFYMLSADEREWLDSIGVRGGTRFNPPTYDMRDMRRRIAAGYR